MTLFYVILAGAKRGREEENEENRPESLHTTSSIKKSRLDPSPSLQVNILLCTYSHVLNKGQRLILKCLCKVTIFAKILILLFDIKFACLLCVSWYRFFGCVQGNFSLVIFVNCKRTWKLMGQTVYLKHALLFL